MNMGLSLPLSINLHQSLKYYRVRERKINGSVKPFTKVESHFANARFFEEDDTLKAVSYTHLTLPTNREV